MDVGGPLHAIGRGRLVLVAHALLGIFLIAVIFILIVVLIHADHCAGRALLLQSLVLSFTLLIREFTLVCWDSVELRDRDAMHG